MNTRYSPLSSETTAQTRAVQPTPATEAVAAAVRTAYAQYGTEAARWLEGYQARSGQVFCGAGCFGCCNMPIRLSLAEALVLRGALSSAELAAVETHARAVLRNARTAPDEDTYVRRHRLEVGYCPLLSRDTGACAQYAARPTRCRDTFSAFPARYCTEGYWESLSPHEKRNYAREVARTPGTDGELHYIAPLEYLSEPVWEAAAAAMDDAFGLQIWGDFWVLVSLSTRADFMEAVEAGDGRAALKAAQRAGLAHPLILDIE